MNKYLYVEFINNADVISAKSCGIEDSGKLPKHRIVKVKLTDDQIKQLEPRHIPNGDCPDYIENMRLICIQEE